MSPSVSVRLLSTQSDAKLLGLAQDGHERAFEALVRRYRRPLLSYCRRLLLSEERAEDTVQQALLQAWMALSSGAEVTNARPWLYRIVHNAALNALRVSGYDYCTLSESLSGAGAPQEDLDRRIAVREALAGLAALPEMQREALLRTAVEGASHRRVAQDLGLSESTLRGLVYRARTSLRAAMGALTPAPLLNWALGTGERGMTLAERAGEFGLGGGSAGIAGLLAKGGAVALSTGVLVGGAHLARPHLTVTIESSSPPQSEQVRAGSPARGAGEAQAALASSDRPAASPLDPSLGLGRRRKPPRAGRPLGSRHSHHSHDDDRAGPFPSPQPADDDAVPGHGATPGEDSGRHEGHSQGRGGEDQEREGEHRGSSEGSDKDRGDDGGQSTTSSQTNGSGPKGSGSSDSGDSGGSGGLGNSGASGDSNNSGGSGGSGDSNNSGGSGGSGDANGSGGSGTSSISGNSGGSLDSGSSSQGSDKGSGDSGSRDGSGSALSAPEAAG